MQRHTGVFKRSDLVKVDESRSVVHGSGGPAMQLICIEGENALCEFWDSERQATVQVLFLTICLRRMVRLDEAFISGICSDQSNPVQ